MIAKITRGTSPTITCRIPGDLTESHLFFSIGAEDRHSWVTVDYTQMTVVYNKVSDETIIQFTLTQKQTCACKAGKAYAQFRAVDIAGNGMVSNKTKIEICDVIKDGVISYG